MDKLDKVCMTLDEFIIAFGALNKGIQELGLPKEDVKKVMDKLIEWQKMIASGKDGEHKEIILKAPSKSKFYGDEVGLVNRHTEYETWVVAEGIQKDDEYGIHWGQGHYFESLPAAMYWFSYYTGYVPPRERTVSYDRMSEIATRFKDILEDELTFSGTTLYEVVTSSEYDLNMSEEELNYFEICPVEDEEDDEDDLMDGDLEDVFYRLLK